MLLIACGDRREAVCPPCAARYRADLRHLIRAGLAGRVGVLADGADAVPASVSAHPVVFATLTAPSFGAVHRSAGEPGGPCRPRSGRPHCAHGYRRWCDAWHASDDPRTGTPLCYECYDYAGHVMWHGVVPELWRRFVIYTYRALARAGSAATGERVTVRAVRGLLRVSYVKVAEYQRRGAVHLHAVMRLDGVNTDGADSGDGVVAPPGWADAGTLAAAVKDAAGRVAVRLPVAGGSGGGVARTARWGGQVDAVPVTDPGRVVGYLAKYATKSAGDVLAGLPPRRFGRTEGRAVLRRVSAHVSLLVQECFRLGARPELARLRLNDYPHTLGFRGHFASKSRRYAMTLGALRAVRRAWRSDRSADRSSSGAGDPWAAARAAERSGGDSTVILRSWTFGGQGWARLGDADLAASLARDHAAWREARDLAVASRAGDGNG
ncbi:hypothetical protein K1Y72_30345 [Actinomadura sp. PM05-2]|uniref:Replication initiation protein n=1 Tax=Actinomadura parmotrematis TaxID=2864039 RepID=A0ABS7G4H5_9ACTN|nr:hypothetical protein [Actinomadura parmotrematis]